MTVIAKYAHGSLKVSYGREIRQADFIGESASIRFYEDPFYGDETGLWAVFKGQTFPTDYFELPDAEEIGDPADFCECYA